MNVNDSAYVAILRHVYDIFQVTIPVIVLNRHKYLLFRWIIPVVLISILNKSVGTSSTATLLCSKFPHSYSIHKYLCWVEY